MKPETNELCLEDYGCTLEEYEAYQKHHGEPPLIVRDVTEERLTRRLARVDAGEKIIVLGNSELFDNSPDFGVGKTEQCHKDECDINSVMKRAAHGVSLSHLANHGGRYGDFSDWDENTYQNLLDLAADAKTIFNDLPAEIRMNEFDNNPGKFFKFVNDPENNERLAELLPELAEPGRQLPDVVGGQIGSAAAKAIQTALASASSNDAPSDPDASDTNTQ